MSEIIRIEIAFPVGVTLSGFVYRYLHDVLDEIAAEYECANPGRVMWAAGEGGRAPPGFVFDEPRGEWDMSVLCIDFAERERYNEDERARPSIAQRIRKAALEEAADAVPHEAEKILALVKAARP